MHALVRGLLLPLLVTGGMFAGTVNVSINTSSIAGSAVGVAIDFTTSSPGAATFCSPTCLNVLNFAAPGSTMGLPSTTGGLVQGDLILIENPAPFTQIEKGSAFNEVVVNLNPVGSLISFMLNYSDTGPAAGFPPDEISVFLLDSGGLPLFPTSDPTGADSLFVIDLTGVTGGAISAFAPTTITGTNLSVVVPSQSTAAPEPGGLLLLTSGLLVLMWASRARLRKRSL